jgi:hypothetical protein
VLQPDNDAEDVTESAAEPKSTQEYLKMLHDLGDLALNRGNEEEFKAFAKASHKIQAILCWEHNASMKDRTIFDFFKSREVKGDQESKASSPKGLISEPIVISDSESGSEMSLDN